eukprot:358177-Chlamydomonas_euryale.AAC.1
MHRAQSTDSRASQQPQPRTPCAAHRPQIYEQASSPNHAPHAPRTDHRFMSEPAAPTTHPMRPAQTTDL